MHLYAIAIYTSSETHEFKRMAYSQKDKAFFAKNELEKLEKITLPSLSEKLREQTIYCRRVEDEYHYVKAEEGRVTAISTRGKLTTEECGHLFKNINHVYTRPGVVKTTLDSIIANPLGYTGRDLLIGRLSDSLEEVKVIMMENIDKALARGENLEKLKEKSGALAEASIKFEKSSKHLNSCCR